MTYPSVFFINLDRAEKRAIYMWNEIDKLGLRPQTERVSAVDARQGPVRDAFRRNIFSMDCYQLEDSSIACTESHRKAWRRMLELNLDCAVFLEDDMVFTPGFSSAISEIAGSPLKFSVVKLDGVPEKVRLGTPIACGTVSVRPLHQTLYSSGAYMLSRRGAERLLEETETYSRAIDLLMFEPRADWSMYQADPAIAVQGVHLSENERARLPEVITGSNRDYGAHTNGAEIHTPTWFRWKRIVQRRIFNAWPNALWRNRAFVRRGGRIEQVKLQGGFLTYRSYAAPFPEPPQQR